MPRRALLFMVAIAFALAACSEALPSTTTVPSATTDSSGIIQTRADTQAHDAQLIPMLTARPPRIPLPRPARGFPFTAPASCAVSPMAGEVRRTFPAWWLDGDGLWAGNPLGVYYVGDNKVQWQSDQMGLYNQNDAVTASGTRLDGPAPTLRLDNPSNIGTGFSSGMIFPTPGCWQLHGAIGAQTLDAVVYVFPDGCAPEGMRNDPVAFACMPPAMPAITSCPVTQPPQPPLVPPPVVSAGQFIGTDAFWYGGKILWVTLLAQGILLQNDKMVWWHTVPGWLAVEGRRLDAPSPPLTASIPAGYDDMNLQATGLDFPTPGCWEVTGRISGHELRFVVNVVPNGRGTATPAGA